MVNDQVERIRRLSLFTHLSMVPLAQAQADLSEYRFLVGEEWEEYKVYKSRIDENIYTNNILELRAQVETLREEIDWEKFTTGRGEAILESLSHWSVLGSFALFIMGIIPVLGEAFLEDQNALSFLNWAFLGMAGAVGYTVWRMRRMDTTRVGEDEGNWVLRSTLLGLVVGAISAVLLYMAISGGVFGGKALPQLNKDVRGIEEPLAINALSIFWGIVSGFSAKLLDRLVRTSEGVTSE